MDADDLGDNPGSVTAMMAEEKEDEMKQLLMHKLSLEQFLSTTSVLSWAMADRTGVVHCTPSSGSRISRCGKLLP